MSLSPLSLSLLEFVCDCVSIPIESILVESIKNATPYNIISDFSYLLALNAFILEISKETFNNEELKQGHVEPIKEETRFVNL